MSRYVRNLARPDETIEIAHVRSDIVTVGGVSVSRDVHAPGWRWSTHIRPLVGGTSCQVRHLGVLLQGRVHIRLDDGYEFEIGPDDVFEIPPAHDAWVVGDEEAIMLAWSGSRTWLAPVTSLAERVLATILFTDIVDSTAHAHRMGDRSWAELVGSFETATRDVLSRFRGHTVKMTGDGVLATFDGAGRAIRAAVALRGLATDFGLELRAALHTGEIEIEEADIRGLAVHEASRMLGSAGPGDVLVSATTRQLAHDAGIFFEDRGEHELRGLDGPRRLYRVSDAPA